MCIYNTKQGVLLQSCTNEEKVNIPKKLRQILFCIFLTAASCQTADQTASGHAHLELAQH